MLCVQVTKADIRKGKPNRCTLCPIALAARRALGFKVSVTGYEITTGRGRTIATLPLNATDFVMDFDSGRSVKPFNFNIWETK